MQKGLYVCDLVYFVLIPFCKIHGNLTKGCLWKADSISITGILAVLSISGKRVAVLKAISI
jgi:hypothetical protein